MFASRGSVAESYIKKLREQGVLELHQGEDTSQDVAKSGARKLKMTRVTRVIFFQNVTRIGLNAFVWAQKGHTKPDAVDGQLHLPILRCVPRKASIAFWM